MKRLFICATILSLFAMSSTSSANAFVNNNEKGTISVNITSDTEIVPDTAEISFAIKTADTNSMQKAAMQNKEISDKVLSELKSLINAKNGDAVEKMAAGMGNSILIPRAWLGDKHCEKFVPYVLAYKPKKRQ